MTDVNNLSIILIADNDSVQGAIFQEYFHNYPSVSVTKNPFEELSVIDCLVLPCPSSFGYTGHSMIESYLK